MSDEQHQKPFDERLLKIIESTLISIAASVPVIASFATGWNELKNQIQLQNIEDILTSFADELQKIDDKKIDRNYLQSIEAKQLIVRTIYVGMDEVRDEKRRMLSTFLANGSSLPLSKDSEKDMILDVIDKLSPFQITLLEHITIFLVDTAGKDNVELGSDYVFSNKRIYFNKEDEPPPPKFSFMSEAYLVRISFTSVPPEITQSCLNYMESLGVVETLSSRGLIVTERWKSSVKQFRPTKLGLRVLEYLGISLESIELKLKLSTQEFIQEMNNQKDADNLI